MYDVLTYTSDETCMEEPHQQEMSFGKYRAYLELAEYDSSVTVEDCHGMTMGEIQGEIDSCRNHQQTRKRQHQGGGNSGSQGNHHEEHHGDHE